MAGFGAAIKMLGLGFASGRGKSEIHSSQPLPPGQQIDWTKAQLGKDGNNIIWNPKVVYSGHVFNERVAKYALAASLGKHHIYLTFAFDITENCDCDAHHMDCVYDDLGIFASTDPVAIDKAVIDVLTQREGKVPFAGTEIFTYAEKIGLGTAQYKLETVN